MRAIDYTYLVEPNLLIPGKKPIGNVKIDASRMPSYVEAFCVFTSEQDGDLIEHGGGSVSNTGEFTPVGDFDGAGCYIDSGYTFAASTDAWAELADGIIIPSTPYCIHYKFKTTMSDVDTLVSLSTDTGTHSIKAWHDGDGSNRMRLSVGSQTRNHDVSFSSGEWHDIVLFHNDSNEKLYCYVDGVYSGALDTIAPFSGGTLQRRLFVGKQIYDGTDYTYAYPKNIAFVSVLTTRTDTAAAFIQACRDDYMQFVIPA